MDTLKICNRIQELRSHVSPQPSRLVLILGSSASEVDLSVVPLHLTCRVLEWFQPHGVASRHLSDITSIGCYETGFGLEYGSTSNGLECSFTQIPFVVDCSRRTLRVVGHLALPSTAYEQVETGSETEPRREPHRKS